MRIVPFMGFFYASFALICPFVTDAFMKRGQSYAEAQVRPTGIHTRPSTGIVPGRCIPPIFTSSPPPGTVVSQGNAGTTVMLSGFVLVEAVVELRGCGVTFGQMNPAAFLLFIPALVGRLATVNHRIYGYRCLDIYM